MKNLDKISDQEYERYRHGWNCPRCGSPMVERRNSKTGTPFFGCSIFPECTGTRDADGSSDEELGSEVEQDGYSENYYDDYEIFDFN